jgi:uncharacterized protein
MVELNHRFVASEPTENAWEALLDLDRVIPCVDGAKVLERVSPESVKAEIKVKMGAMSIKYVGTVTVTTRDDDAHRAVLEVRSREADGQGNANAEVTLALTDEGGTIHTTAQITGRAAAMGEGVITPILDAMITSFAGRLATM